MNVRDAKLRGVREAIRVHQQLNTEGFIRRFGGGVDVFGSLVTLDVALLFRPLDGLLGACIPGSPTGVIISTNRSLPVQRFTGAHELGHFAMQHDISLDNESNMKIIDVSRPSNRQEVEANAFAAEFLLPKWLFSMHGTKQGWSRASIADPANVYQLALRVGASYEATCYALRHHNSVDAATYEKLLGVRIKSIKQQMLPSYAPENWHRNVWLLTKHDEGSRIEGQPDDLFLFRLNEKSGAGYLWDFEALKNSGFAIVVDERTKATAVDAVVGAVRRTVAAQSMQPAIGEVLLAQRRPWQVKTSPIETLHLSYDLLGKEVGMSRAERRQLEAA